MKKTINRGFTIVELLVVIVVIGILAAITMVSYSGVTTKANSTAAKSNAASVQQIISTYYADNNTAAGAGNGVWPATAALVNTYSSNAASLAKLPGTITLVESTTALTAAIGTKNISYKQSASTLGGCIAYFDFSTSKLNFLFLGTATTATEGISAAVGQIATCS